MNSEPFLKEIASILLQKDHYQLDSVCVVFPGKRARLYLSRYIGELTSEPVWAPQYISISELLEKVSGYILADRLTLIFELYDVYCRVTGSNESFDSFYSYSETLLSDFDEVDKYLANADDLFSNMAGLKAIDGKFNYLTDEQVALIQKFWGTFNPEKISPDQLVFINLWSVLGQIYHLFRQQLSDKKLAYEGMAFRKAIEIIENSSSEFFPKTKYIFVGFNALNTCEEKLFFYLQKRGKADFFWDFDDWYINNDVHEAGFFIRSNLRKFPPVHLLKTNNLIQKKANRTFFVPVYSNSGQAAILPSVFEKMDLNTSHDAENTAVVLADENLLMPVLYSIPEQVTEINVTMGYPVSGSAIYSLIDSLYQLTRNSRHNKDGMVSWYYRDVVIIMNNPLTKYLYGSKVDPIKSQIAEKHITYLSSDQISEKDDLIFSEFLFQHTCRHLLEIVAALIRNTNHDQPKNTQPVLTEILFQVYTSLTRLQDIFDKTGFNPGPEMQFRLIRKILGNLNVPFTGEPLAGLQVLGILETRTLDFENVILLSANEGVLPKSTDNTSFIPYNLRTGFGLPTPEYHDAIYAYYFYRLIQRAGNVSLVYDASSGGLKTGERSRYLHQLMYEMQLPVVELNTNVTLSAIPVKPIIIFKDRAIKEKLWKYTGDNPKLLSPSAINEFLNCQLRFYFHHIAGVPQPEESGEEIDARLFGNIIHTSLCTLYKDFVNKIVTKEKLEKILSNTETLEQVVNDAYCQELFGEPNGMVPEGYNIIITRVIIAYLRQFLIAEMQACPFSIVSLEERHEIFVKIEVDGRETRIKTGGIIDRIDRYEGRIRILDYKTGTVKDGFDGLVSLFAKDEKFRNDAVFQVFLYAYVYYILHPEESIQPGLFFLRNSHNENFGPFIKGGDKKYILDFKPLIAEFEEKLTGTLERLFDFNEPFTQTTELKHCGFCPYASVCRRANEK